MLDQHLYLLTFNSGTKTLPFSIHFSRKWHFTFWHSVHFMLQTAGGSIEPPQELQRLYSRYRNCLNCDQNLRLHSSVLILQHLPMRSMTGRRDWLMLGNKMKWNDSWPGRHILPAGYASLRSSLAGVRLTQYPRDKDDLCLRDERRCCQCCRGETTSLGEKAEAPAAPRLPLSTHIYSIYAHMQVRPHTHTLPLRGSEETQS